MSDDFSLTERKPPTLQHSPRVQGFKDAYKTACAKCPSMLAIPLPFTHCPSCCNRWRARGLKAPNRCPACNFNLGRWRLENNVPERSNATALIA
jgi:hypothetical protein